MYTVKGVQSHFGTDGVATYCKVYRDGKAIAEFIDNGDGASSIVRFINNEEARLAHKFIRTNPNYVETYNKYKDIDGWEGIFDIFIEDLCNEYDKAKEKRRLEKKLQKETWFRLRDRKYKQGEWVGIKVPFSAEIHQRLQAKHGQNLGEILNLKPELIRT